MTDETARNLALALGLKTTGEYWFHPNGNYILLATQKGYRHIRDGNDLAAWLNSAEGEKAARDRVRDLAGRNSVAYFYEPCEKHRHSVCISSGDEDDFKEHKMEAAAWQAALEWLVEKGQSDAPVVS